MASQWEQIKWIPGTKLMVDGFRYQNPECKSYLLTHFHSDHTTGLTKSFTAGLIFCTPVTARLLRKDMGMPPERICEIPMDKVTLIEGHEVVPVDANHCPGACMFLIRTKGTLFKKSQTILHTGDMRWSDCMAEHPAIKSQRIDLLFMDTTYAKPTHTHPPQDFCIQRMVETIKAEREKNPKTLFVCGSYHIGKERAYLGAAKILGCKVWCDANKRRVLRMLDLPDELMLLLTTKPHEALIHVDFLGALQPERLQKRIHTSPWTHAVGFRPTGWTYRKNGKLDCRHEGNVKVYGIPYSEHSSWSELRSCVTLLRPKKLIPTVNAANAALAEIIVNRFADCMDLSGDKSRLDFFMRKRQKTSHPPEAKISPTESAAEFESKENLGTAEDQSAIKKEEESAQPLEADVLGKVKDENCELPSIKLEISSPEEMDCKGIQGQEFIKTPELKPDSDLKKSQDSPESTPPAKISSQPNFAIDRSGSNESTETQSPAELLFASTQPISNFSRQIFPEPKAPETDGLQIDDSTDEILTKQEICEERPKGFSRGNLPTVPVKKEEIKIGEGLLDFDCSKKRRIDQNFRSPPIDVKLELPQEFSKPQQVVDLDCFCIDEQEKIFQSIQEEKARHRKQLVNSLSRTKQPSISLFFRK